MSEIDRILKKGRKKKLEKRKREDFEKARKIVRKDEFRDIQIEFKKKEKKVKKN